MSIKLNRDKLKAVVHYICHSRRDDPSTLGRVKLHKILYFSDMLHYLDTGEPLTGVDYVKQPFGPTARHLKWALDTLSAEKKIEMSIEPYFGFEKHVFLSKMKPATNFLSERETHLLDDVIAFVSERTANEISDLSHQEPWESARIGETISYDTAYQLIPAPEITDEAVDWGRQEIARLGL